VTTNFELILEGAYAKCEGREQNVVFAHMSEIEEADWPELTTDILVTFEFGFTLRGPVALRVRLAK